MDTINWKQTNGAVPLHVVQLIPVDSSNRMLMLHRSEAVRSAKNVWSFPSGMHDIGESAVQCGQRELGEEFGLRCLPSVSYLGTYENIAGDPLADAQYHWVITLLGLKVQNLDEAVNKEPDKHDQMVMLPLTDLMRPDFFKTYPFHASFSHWAADNVFSIFMALVQLANSGK